MATTVDHRLGPDEHVTRYIHHAGDFSRLANRAKASAFDPGSRSGEISAAHISGLTDTAIWELARNTISEKPGRQVVLARADVRVGVLEGQGLEAIRDNDPFERHTAIKGWKAETRKAIALELALAATLRLPPAPVRKAD